MLYSQLLISKWFRYVLIVLNKSIRYWYLSLYMHVVKRETWLLQVILWPPYIASEGGTQRIHLVNLKNSSPNGSEGESYCVGDLWSVLASDSVVFLSNLPVVQLQAWASVLGSPCGFYFYFLNNTAIFLFGYLYVICTEGLLKPVTHFRVICLWSFRSSLYVMNINPLPDKRTFSPFLLLPLLTSGSTHFLSLH